MKRFLSSCARLPRVVISIGLGLTTLAALGHTAAYAGTVYSISNSLSGTSVQSGWTVSGSIELHDTTAFGAITSSDIKNWNWTASKPGSSSLSASSATNGQTNTYGPLTATATGLYVAQGDNFVSFGLGDQAGNSFLAWENYYGTRFQLFDFLSNPYTKFSVAPMDFPVNATYGYQIATTAIPLPEPSTCVMALAGLACGGYTMFRRRRAR